MAKVGRRRLADEERRLRALFEAALLVAALPGGLVACTSEGASARDAGANLEASNPAADDAGEDAGIDAAACTSEIWQLDAETPDGEPLCKVELPCGLSWWQLSASGCAVGPAGFDAGWAAGSHFACALAGTACLDAALGENAPATLECACDQFFGGGRRSRETRRRGAVDACRGPRARYLARMAIAEAESVHAFAILGAELRHHGAPSELVEAAEASRQDERRHARTFSRLASRTGATWTDARVREDATPRSLEALAHENAAEGCVRETYAALLACWQARVAADPEVRGVMRGLARDETRHAALAWAVSAWALPRLSPAARRRVATTYTRALKALTTELRATPAPALTAWAGLPTPEVARALAEAAFGRS